VCIRFIFVLMAVTSSLAQSQTAASPGAQLFNSTCAACHGIDGKGGEHAPNIVTAVKIRALFDRDLANIIRTGIPASGMPGFGSSFNRDQIEALVKYVRILQGRGVDDVVAGDAERGRALFAGKASCSGCHMMNGEGGFIGGDLSGYGKTHNAAEIREAIVDPNKNVDLRHGVAIAVTRDGREFKGIVRNEDNFSLQMQTADGAFQLLDKADLSKLEHKAQSLMPADYGTKLTKNELDDVVKYLLKASSAQTAGEDKDEE
jgi:cytochrome c oxidase cbb3-type subunit III